MIPSIGLRASKYLFWPVKVVVGKQQCKATALLAVQSISNTNRGVFAARIGMHITLMPVLLLCPCLCVLVLQAH
jgi:hypothetical protein